MIKTINGHDYDVVTDDTRLDGLLRARSERVGSRSLGRYAMELGIQPTGWKPGDPVPPISMIFPPCEPDGVFTWFVYDPDDEPGEEDGEPDDGPDPWAALDD